MPLVACPGCGKQISAVAPTCIHCGTPRGGFPQTGGVLAAPRSGTSPLVVVLIAAGVGVGLIMVLGIVAAIAIPRFSMVARAAKEAEALPVLRQVVDREQEYHQQAGVFTSDLSRLPGWQPPLLRYYTLQVSDASETSLCVEATPRPESTSEGLTPQSMDQALRLYRDVGCGAGMGEDSTAAGADTSVADLPEAEGEGVQPVSGGKPSKP
jgi:type II secretory pathway pseudopilin PulG